MTAIKILPIMFLLLFLAACTAAYTADAPELIRPVSARVDTIIVDRGPVTELTMHMGITRYLSEVLYFENPVAAFYGFHVSPGDTVVEGQLLASLDTEQIEEQIADRLERLAVMRAEHSLTNEQRQIAIDIMVIENANAVAAAAENFDIAAGIAAEMRQLDIEWAQMELRLERERQALSIRHEEERLQALRARLEYTELHAPFDGIITFIYNINRGQNISIGQSILYISDMSETIIELVGLTGSDFPSGGGGPIQWRPFAVRDANYTYAHIDGRVYELEFIVTAQERRHYRPVQFAVVTGEIFPPGMLFPVYFYIVRLDDVIRVPTNSVFFSADGIFVHRMVNNELIHTEIEMITRTTAMVAVAAGLEVGDEIFVRP